MRRARAATALAAAVVASAAAAPCAAQSDTARRPVELSGLIFGSFQYHVEPGTTPSEEQQVSAGLEQNQFSLDRAYLTALAQAGPKASVRVTTRGRRSPSASPGARATSRAATTRRSRRSPSTVARRSCSPPSR